MGEKARTKTDIMLSDINRDVRIEKKTFQSVSRVNHKLSFQSLMNQQSQIRQQLSISRNTLQTFLRYLIKTMLMQVKRGFLNVKMKIKKVKMCFSLILNLVQMFLDF